MMENCHNFIRVRVDLCDVGLPFVKRAWVSVDRSVQRTVRDFKLSLYPKFKLPEDRNISLYLQECLLPDEEPIFLLRDDDIIRVVYENLPSLLDSQCNGFVSFASTGRSSVRRITDGSCDVSFPAAKKAKVLPPVLITESFHDISDAQTSVSDVACLADISTEINTDGKTESVKKKHKKREKHLKVKSKDNSENSFYLENGFNNSTSEAREIGGHPSDELGNLIMESQDHQDECDMRSPKKRKVKEEKPSGKNVIKLSKQVNEISSVSENNAGCTDGKKTKRADVVFSMNSDKHKNNSVPEKTFSKKHEVSEKEISNKGIVQPEKGASVKSDGNSADVQKLGGESGDVSTVELPYVAEGVNGLTRGSITQKTEREVTDVIKTSLHEISRSVFSLPPHAERNSTVLDSSHSQPIQMQGDCTKSLGNNCPKKKKRTRRGKRKSQQLSVPSDNVTADYSGKLLPPSEHSIGESVGDFIRDVRNEYNGRKHIRFTESSESNCAGIILDNDYSGISVSTPVSAVVDASHSSQDAIKTTVLSLETIQNKEAEKAMPPTSFLQKEQVSCAMQNGCADGTKNKTNIQETSDSSLKEKKKLYENFPPLNRFPVVGDVIAFKMLELTDLYCPEVSDYKEGRVVKINSSTDVLEIDLVEEQIIPVRTGKFENLYPDEELEPQVVKKVHVQWSAMIEPKLISQD